VQSGKAIYVFPQLFLVMILIHSCKFIQDYYPFDVVQNYCNKSAFHSMVEKILKTVVVLQNCTSLLKVEPGSYNETNHAGDQIMNIDAEELKIKAEEYTD
jgi:hypothetical protein